MKAIVVAVLALLFLLPPTGSAQSADNLSGCSVVEIRTGKDYDGGIVSQATGFVAGKNIVVTVKHEIEDAITDADKKIYVNVRGEWRKAKLIYAPAVKLDEHGRETQESDPAIISVDTSDLPAIPFAKEVPQKGDELSWYQYGCNSKFGGRLKSVAKQDRWIYTGCRPCASEWRIYSANFLELDGHTPGGSSGSPVLYRGEVVGLIFSGGIAFSEDSPTARDVAHAIGAEEIAKRLKTLTKSSGPN